MDTTRRGCLSPTTMWVVVLLVSLAPIFSSFTHAQGKAERAEQALFARAIETHLAEMTTQGFSGSVVTARAGKVLITKTYGRAAMVGRAPRYWIASNSKSFVAAAIMKLQEDAKLSVSDRLTKFFEDVPVDKEQITVHHLLTHTSGLPHRYASDGIADRRIAVRAILNLPLRSRIGETYSYSNDGYSLLAAIVEAASGRTFEEYLKSNILRPAGLKQTGFWGFEGQQMAPRISDSNDISESVFKNGRGVPNWGYRGASGMYSTSGDLYEWLLSLRAYRVVNAQSLNAIWGKHVAMAGGDAESFYGYGWRSGYKSGKRMFVRHTGFEDWLGHSSVMTSFENGDAIVVLSNSGRRAGSAWATAVEAELRKILGH